MIEIDFGICGSEKELEVKGYVNREVRKRKKTNRIKPKKVCACRRAVREEDASLMHS